MSPIILIAIFIVCAFIGYKLISNVPTLLHTPLMSGMNALAGVTVLGAIVAANMADSIESNILIYAALVLAMINVAAGFGVTDRMLKMFKRKKPTANKGR